MHSLPTLLIMIAVPVLNAQTPPFTSLSAASFGSGPFPSESIVSGFGSNLANATVSAASAELPTTLGGVNVLVIDSALEQRQAPLHFVSPSQINYVMPSGVRPGTASILVRNGTDIIASGTVQLATVAPALFTAAQTGSGLASARAIVVSPAGSQTSSLTFQCTSGRCVPEPIRNPENGGQVYLELYGTGIRGRGSLSSIQATISGVSLQVLYAGPQNQYAGLDQVNLQVPSALFNSGVVQLLLTVDGVRSNSVSLQFGGSGAPGAVSVIFDPARPDVGPFPTNALTVPDAAQKTGLRVNLPLPDCAVQRTTCETYRLLNELDGFNLHPRIVVRFSGPVDTNTLQRGIRILWLENVNAEEKGLRPAGHISGIERAIFDPATNTLYAKPDEPMDQHRRYVILVTDAVRDALGSPVVADPAFRNCIGAVPNDYCTQLAQAQATTSPLPGQIVSASVFTTLSATSWLERARMAGQTTPPDVKRGVSVNLGTTAAATLRQQTTTNPAGFEDATVPVPALVTAGADRVTFGAYTSPDFLDTRHTIPTAPTAAPLAAPGSTTEITFHAFTPSGSAPASGYPVIVFGHGLGDSAFGAPTLVAGSFARSGFATLVINAVGHGSGPQTELVLTSLSGQRTTVAVPGRGVDTNNDGRIASREGCMLTASGIAVRDCLRQTAVDLMQLVRAIRTGIDLDGDGTPDLDPGRIYFAGQSLGALYGTLFTAVEPDVRAAAFNVGGGTVADIGAVSDQFKPLARDILAMHVPPVLNAGNDFNANPVLRNQPVRVNDVPGAIEVQNYLELLEWLQATGDPISYAPHLRLSPLLGVPEKRSLFQIARGDRTIPNPANANLIRKAGGEGMTVMYRHDVARANSAGLSENPHAFLVDFRSIHGTAVARAAQDQIVGFFAADGNTIPDANSTALSLLFLGNNVFERPAAPPEDLGF
jgi:uncharacterized protein (TIGR03437 family)